MYYFYLFLILEKDSVGVNLISREREATIWDPLNVGAAKCCEYVLRPLATQGTKINK
jgi:hypothetical protein